MSELAQEETTIGSLWPTHAGQYSYSQKDGYQMWRDAFNAGRAGIYTITLAEAVKVMETTLNQ